VLGFPSPPTQLRTPCIFDHYQHHHARRTIACTRLRESGGAQTGNLSRVPSDHGRSAVEMEGGSYENHIPFTLLASVIVYAVALAMADPADTNIQRDANAEQVARAWFPDAGQFEVLKQQSRTINPLDPSGGSAAF
jgi:hypothetical protein